jgi:methylmalonyl-CoA mutase cobalamin-binding domain/chain
MSDPYANLACYTREGDIDQGVREALELVHAGVNPVNIFTECIEPTLAEVGDQFSRLEIFLPEMMNSAECVKAIQQALLPYIKNVGSISANKKIVIATVFGDLHDIGKNIVKTMLEVNGFEVRDLGVDVNPDEVLKSAAEFNADIIALSALMLTSLPSVKDVIDRLNQLEKYKHRFMLMVGGGSVTAEWAQTVGVDGYGRDAVEAVQVARKLLGLT